MGDFVRRFWLPFCSRTNSCPTAAAAREVTGERLVAFRATDGQVGLVDEFCPHRRAPMFFGRNEEDGLRCVYHGWKFDRAGTCTDMLRNRPTHSSRRSDDCGI